MNLDRFSHTLHRPGVDWDAVRERLEAKAALDAQERKDKRDDTEQINHDNDPATCD